MPDVSTLLPWISLALNLLLVPGIRMLMTITNKLTALQTMQGEHGRRLDRVDTDMGELRGEVQHAMRARAFQ